MKKQITYPLIIFLFLFVACQSEHKTEVVKKETPPFQTQLVNWSAMNKTGWKNMSFPIWFTPTSIDSLEISKVKVEFINYNFTDSIINVSDTIPYRKILLDFNEKGEVKKVIVKEMNSGIKIAEYIFSYKQPLDAMGYSAPVISSNVKYREKNVFSIFNTFQELQQYQRMVLVESDSLFLSYLDKSSAEESHHYFILDSTYWNVSFIDQKYAPQGKNIFYYGSPKNYTSSFSLINLVEKSMKEERSYYSTNTLKSQYFYSNDFVTKRYFHYDSIGMCVGFDDSLMTAGNDFLHLEKGVIEYEKNLPKLLKFYNEEDSLMTTPIKQMQLKYFFKE